MFWVAAGAQPIAKKQDTPTTIHLLTQLCSPISGGNGGARAQGGDIVKMKTDPDYAGRVITGE